MNMKKEFQPAVSIEEGAANLMELLRVTDLMGQADKQPEKSIEIPVRGRERPAGERNNNFDTMGITREKGRQPKWILFGSGVFINEVKPECLTVNYRIVIGWDWLTFTKKPQVLAVLANMNSAQFRKLPKRETLEILNDAAEILYAESQAKAT